MQTASFIHANHNTEIVIMKDLAFSVYYSPHHRCTMIVSSGGAVAPVKESVTEVCARLGLTTITETATKTEGDPHVRTI